MDAEPKQAVLGCPFCGGECTTVEYSGTYSVDCLALGDDWCAYESGVRPTESEAIAAHNALCRKVALFGDLVELLTEVHREPQDGSVYTDGHSLAWELRRDALLTRARGETGVGS